MVFQNLNTKKILDFGGNLGLKSGISYIFYKMFNHLLETDYRRMNSMNHVGYCIVMYRFIEKCSFGLQLFLNVKK